MFCYLFLFHFQEAAERFSDTSWQIHRQWRDGRKPLALEPKPDDKTNNNETKRAKSEPEKRNGTKTIDYAIVETKPNPNTKQNGKTVRELTKYLTLTVIAGKRFDIIANPVLIHVTAANAIVSGRNWQSTYGGCYLRTRPLF